MTITITWWMIPTIITISGILYALTYDDGGGYLSGIGNMILLVPILCISLVSWIIAAILK